jgi:cytochrome c-type biogenesis protein CcmH
VRRIAAGLAVATALAVAAPAQASERHPTLPELEDELMCLVCNTTIAESNSPFADRERTLIRQYIAEGDTKSEIKAKFVAQFGPQILAAPPDSGFNILAWWLPIVGIVAAGIALAALAWWWSRGRRGPPEPPAGPPIDPALEQKLDRELARFDA